MGTILREKRVFPPRIIIPAPGEGMRAGGGIGKTIDIPGADKNGTISYTGLVLGARVKHFGGISKKLGVMVNGTSVDVQNETDGSGNVLSNANDVINEIGGNPTALKILKPELGIGASGLGLAGVTLDYLQLSTGPEGSIYPSFQDVSNRTSYIYWEAGSFSAHGARLSCYDGKTISVGPLPGVGPITTKTAITIITIGLAASTWYYLYANLDTLGNVAFSYSTTPPDATLSYLVGSNELRYAGCFVTDASKKIIPFQAVRGRYNYEDPPAGAVGLSATAYTKVSLTNFVPPHVTMVFLRCFLLNANISADDTLYVRRMGSTAASTKYVTAIRTFASGTSNQGESFIVMNTNDKQEIEYFIANATKSTGGIMVDGFQE